MENIRNVKFMQIVIGLLSLVFSLCVLALIVRLWPHNPAVEGESQTWEGLWTCGPCDKLPFEPRMIVIVLLAGALGSVIHAATSFSTYAGNRSFVSSWAWWYLLRVPIGMGLALILYFALRGGFFSPVSNGSVDPQQILNPFGFAAIAALAGMFSKQATDKLKEVFDSLFRTDENDKRGDKLTNLEISKIEPDTLLVGAANPSIRILGKGLSSALTVTFREEVRSHSLEENSLVVQLTTEDVAEPGVSDLKIITVDREIAFAKRIKVAESI